MTYPQYKSDFHHIHQSEVYGKNLFRTACRLKLKGERKKKLELLYQLEIQTLERYIIFANESDQKYKFPFWWAVKGYFDGLVFGLLPWSISMHLLAKGTESFTAIWQRLKTHSSETDRKFFAYVYAHEKAIEAFAKSELKGERESTQSILNLLSQPIKML